MSADDAAWSRLFDGLTGSTPLWLDRAPGQVSSPDGSRIVGEASVGHSQAFAALVEAHGDRTVFTAAWGGLVSYLAGETDALVGVASPDGFRPRRVRRSATTSWLDIIGELTEQTESLGADADLPLERVRERVGIPADQPLFESGLVVGANRPASALPMVLSVACSADGWVLRLDADAARFDEWTVTRTLEHLQTALTAIAADPSQSVDATPFVGSREREQLLVDLNQTTVLLDESATIHELFARQVAERPDAVAVVGGRESLTYRELDTRSNRLARLLVKRGVVPDMRVALCLERTPDVIVTVLAILKAGGGYLPLDPTIPTERLAFMLTDAGVSVVVTESSLADRLPSHSGTTIVIDRERDAVGRELDTPPVVAVGADHLAYVNYTSGSTGTPKGVEVLHRSVNRLVRGVRYVQLGADEVLLHAAPLSFDASTLEIWGALLNGGRLVLYADPVLTTEGLARAIQQNGVTTMWLTAALFNAVIDQDAMALKGVRQLLVGGEMLSVRHIRRAMDLLPGVQLINGYGPTEATTFTCCHRIPRPLDPQARSIPIGRPIRNTQVYILDPAGRLVPFGVAGELYVGGTGLARGYLNRAELTGEKFVANPFSTEPGSRLYRTGDLVRYLPDGTIDFIGRTDTMVKVRGFRIELGEIDATLAKHPSVGRALVIVREDAPGDKRIVAYLVAAAGAEQLTTTALRDYLAATLPEYMVPSAFVWLADLPVSPNGKVDRRALPRPDRRRPDLAVAYLAPRSPVERRICQTFAEVLAVAPVGIADNFFELGGNSLLCLEVIAKLQQADGLQIPVVEFFRNPTPEGLSQFIAHGTAGLRHRVRQERSTRGKASDDPLADAIAIVGMSGRFPGADDVEEFWRNLCAGTESITFWNDDELDPSVPESLRTNPAYVRARGVMRDVEHFDAEFFGINPRDAEVMDPQHRIFLEVAWEALEHAGYTPERFEGLIGIFGGMNDSSYYDRHVLYRPDLVERVGEFQAMVAHEKDYLTTRVAHRLGLTGPALNLQTACSTSLVAVAEAFFSLRNGRCDMALAGGVSITCPPRSGYLYQEGAMLSVDGHTRTFDSDARGTVFSDGVGIVVLKRLADAVADGDAIYAVLRGAAVNSDGAARASFSAPSVDGQAAVVAMAQANAGVDPRTVSYVEAHGTATPLGDPIEVEALTRAFRLGTADRGFCAIGSVKSNLGHLVMAAGVAGLIKTALSLSREQLPPSLHFTAGNSRIDFAGSPFRVNDRLTAWPRSDAPRRAGVSAFGVGGTNAHVVLEEAPQTAATEADGLDQVLVWSARTQSALDAATAALARHLRAHPGVALADVAFTLQTGRKDFPYRRALVAKDAQGAAQALEAGDTKVVASRHLETRAPAVTFMCPGQGSQYAAMGAELYEAEPAYRAAVDACATILLSYLGRDLREPLFHRGDPDAEVPTDTSFVQPALFVTEYALARLWMEWGVEPESLVGHSVGEFVCAVLAGVFSLEDALKLVATRGRLMQELPPGSMLSVRMPAAALAERLTPGLGIASANGPQLSVASGPTADIMTLKDALEAEGVSCRLLTASHAFHSPMMDPVLEPFGRVVDSVRLNPPKIPILSTVTGTWLTDEQATDRQYWTRHLRETVRFADSVRSLWSDGDRLLLEIGPRATLVTLSRQQATDKKRHVTVASLGDRADGERAAVLSAAGQLWMAGVPIDWKALHGTARRQRTPLPTYPFERRRYWIEAPAAERTPIQATSIMHNTAPPTGASPVDALTPAPAAAESRKSRLIRELEDLLESTVGVELDGADPSATFMELGLDSLTLTQAARQIQKTFAVKLTFRQLMEEYTTLDGLAGYIDQQLPPEAAAPVAPAAAPAPAPAAAAPVTPVTSVLRAPTMSTTPAPLPSSPLSSAAASQLQYVIDQQLRLMTQQLALLSGAVPLAEVPAAEPVPQASPAQAQVPAAAPAAPAPVAPTAVAPSPAPAAASSTDESASKVTYDAKKAFGAIARIHLTTAEELSPKQRARLDALVRRYTTRTQDSKRHVEQHRPHLSDPRVVSGFRPVVKELIYPIVVERSKGAHMWDIGGNEYIDVLCGFGAGFFGWQPDFVSAAVKAQIDRGIEIGPQHPLAGELARDICDLTGLDRAGFCNTGSEAVMGAMRIARTVTNRDTIAIFTGSYHGIFDEVIVRATKKLRAVPAAPGIMPSSSQNVLVLDYGTRESIDVLRERAGDLAAIMVEPVQSRRPDFQPKDFLLELRKITEESGALYIFDEMITGFRVHPRGAQGHFGIRADLATYGKLIGGGYPIGIIAGKAQYMDALDGGAWRFGDDSMPTVGVTYFAGTFVRHPLALAAAHSVVRHLIEKGPRLQEEMNQKTTHMVGELNAFFTSVGAPLEIRNFGSMWKTFYTQEQAFGDLLFVYMRDRGVHILDGFPCFLTTAHSDADIAFIVRAFKESVAEMQEAGFMPEAAAAPVAVHNADASAPPVPGARLGRDRDGSPAWYVPDPDKAGQFVKLASK